MREQNDRFKQSKATLQAVIAAAKTEGKFIKYVKY